LCPAAEHLNPDAVEDEAAILLGVLGSVGADRTPEIANRVDRGDDHGAAEIEPAGFPCEPLNALALSCGIGAVCVDEKAVHRSKVGLRSAPNGREMRDRCRALMRS
jgi:hypothetical protein